MVMAGPEEMDRPDTGSFSGSRKWLATKEPDFSMGVFISKVSVVAPALPWFRRGGSLRVSQVMSLLISDDWRSAGLLALVHDHIVAAAVLPNAN